MTIIHSDGTEEQVNPMDILKQSWAKRDEFIQVDLDRQCYVLYGHYDIGFEQCNSHLKLIRWLRHLSEKTWFTSEMAVWFIDAVCDRNHWKQSGL